MSRRPKPPRSVGTCVKCGKASYLSRKDARSVARNRHPGEHMSAYPCGDYWHIGHIPTMIRDGRLDRRDYDPARRTR